MGSYKNAHLISTQVSLMLKKLLKTFSFVAVLVQVQRLRTCLRYGRKKKT